eukprot:scaffold49188_cov31-Tisochrysis_lutea.AAC.2
MPPSYCNHELQLLRHLLLALAAQQLLSEIRVLFRYSSNCQLLAIAITATVAIGCAIAVATVVDIAVVAEKLLLLQCMLVDLYAIGSV